MANDAPSSFPDAESIGVITGALTGVGALIGAVLKFRSSGVKREQQNLDILRGIILDLRTEIGRYKTEVAECHGRIDDLELSDDRRREQVRVLRTELNDVRAICASQHEASFPALDKNPRQDPS